MRSIFKRVASITLGIMAILSLNSIHKSNISLIDTAYAFGGGSYAGGGSTSYNASGMFNDSRTGIRVYVVDKSGQRVSDMFDIVPSDLRIYNNGNIDIVVGDSSRFEPLRIHAKKLGGEIYEPNVEGLMRHWIASADMIEVDTEQIQIDSNRDGALDTTFLNTSKYIHLVPIMTSGFKAKGEMIGTYFTGANKYLPNMGTLLGGGAGSGTVDTTEDDTGDNTRGEAIEHIDQVIKSQFNTIKVQYDSGVLTKNQVKAILYENAIQALEQMEATQTLTETDLNIIKGGMSKSIAGCIDSLPESSLSLNTNEVLDKEDNIDVWELVNSLYDVAYAAEESGEMEPIWADQKLSLLMNCTWYGIQPLDISGALTSKIYDQNGTLNLLASMGASGLTIIMEPLMWNRAQDKDKYVGKYYFYGTPVNYGQFLEAQKAIPDGWTNGDDTGGWIGKGTHNAVPWAMYTKNVLELDCGTVSIGASHPKNGSKLTDSELANPYIGHSLHFYQFAPSSETHTFDNHTYLDPYIYEEHPAPEPEICPELEPMLPELEKERHYNIIKFYEYEMPSMPGSTEVVIQHVSTHERNKTLPKINIMDEIEAGGYEVVEWKWSTDPKASVVTGNAEDGATPWDDMISSISCPPEQKSTDETRIGVVDITKKNADGTLDKESETTHDWSHLSNVDRCDFFVVQGWIVR